MSSYPTVSVVMPVFNGERYLHQAIASIRWQTFSDWELICVDDGSTDNTAEILVEFAAADPRIRVIHQANQGVVAARNHSLQLAQAPWIACLDCDDIAMPERLATQLRFVRENPTVLAVGSNMLCIDAENAPIRIARYKTEHQDIEQALLQGRGDSMAQPSVLMRRDAVFQVGRYRPEYEWVEDADLWLRLAHAGRLANLPQVLTCYRFHEQSGSWKFRKLQHERLQALISRAHEARRLPLPNPTRGRRIHHRKQSAAAGKWARQAARAGYYRSALKHWRRQVKAEPLSLLTIRVTAELVLRGMAALLKKREPQSPLPDWREWDVASATPAESVQEAA